MDVLYIGSKVDYSVFVVCFCAEGEWTTRLVVNNTLDGLGAVRNIAVPCCDE